MKRAFVHTHDLLHQYLKDVQHHSLLKKEEEYQLAVRAKAGDHSAQHLMVLHNVRLVIKIARSYLRPGIEYIDLIEEGNLGLIKAIEKFDPNLHFRFSTYAVWWIRQAIEQAIAKQSYIVHVSDHAMRKERSRLKAKKASSATTPISLQSASNSDSFLLPQSVVSIEATDPKQMDWLMTQVDTDKDANQNPSNVIQAQEIQEYLDNKVLHLPDRYRNVLSRRFGLFGQPAATLQEIGKDLGVSYERIRQIQTEALHDLRIIFENEGIQKLP